MLHQISGIGIFDCFIKKRGANLPSVYINHFVIPVTAVDRGFAEKAGNRNRLSFIIDRNQVVGNHSSEYGINGILSVTVTGRV